MRGPGVLETFAYHCELTKSFKTKSPSGFPAGALGLSAAAVRSLALHTSWHNVMNFFSVSSSPPSI